MNTSLLGYIAAVFDFKGKAFVTRGTVKGAKQHGRPLVAKSYKITLAYNNKDVLTAILDELRSSKDALSWCRQARVGCRHGYYRLDIFGEQAYQFLNAILPYIKNPVKRQSILDALDDSPDIAIAPSNSNPKSSGLFLTKPKVSDAQRLADEEALNIRRAAEAEMDSEEDTTSSFQLT